MHSKPEQKWEPGRLWARMISSTEHALKTGALMPISTETSWITDSGIDFQIRIVSSLGYKREAKKLKGRKSPIPFCPMRKTCSCLTYLPRTCAS